MVPHVAAIDSVVELIPAITPEGVGLVPDRSLDGLIALDELVTDELLDAVADHVCESAEEYGWAPFLDGGFVLVVDGQVFSRPTCCVDLEEGVADWVRLATEWPTSWTGVESGHPGVLARWRDDRVHVSEQADDFPDRIPPRLDVGLDQLRAALPAALDELASFAKRLEIRLAARAVAEPQLRARIVAGLAEEPTS